MLKHVSCIPTRILYHKVYRLKVKILLNKGHEKGAFLYGKFLLQMGHHRLYTFIYLQLFTFIFRPALPALTILPSVRFQYILPLMYTVLDAIANWKS